MSKPVKTYSDLNDEEISRILQKGNFQHCSRKTLRLFLLAIDNDLSLEEVVDAWHNYTERVLIPNKKFFLNEVFK